MKDIIGSTIKIKVQIVRYVNEHLKIDKTRYQ